jgi:hypothetical protein
VVAWHEKQEMHLWAPCKARWVWAGAVAKYLHRPRARCSSLMTHSQRRDAVATGEERHGRCSAGQSEYIRLYRHSGKLALAAMSPRRVRVVGRSFAAGAPPLPHVFTIAACGNKNSAWNSGGPAGGRRLAASLGGGVHCPAPAAQNFGVGLLVTALHVRNLAQKFG